MKTEHISKILKNYSHRNHKNKPLVSIVTVCLNSERYIEQAILSVISQTYANIEYIIIDGGSTDRTIEIIRKYGNFVAHWISQKDSGLFDAMNKGIACSNGEFICFLNSDDFFYSDKSVEYAAQEMIRGGDFIYGKAYFFSSSQHKIIAYSEVKSRDLIFSSICHQSAFCRRSVFDKLGNFNLSYKIAADYEFIVKCFMHPGIKKLFMNKVISSVRAGGNSDKNRNISLKEKRKIIKLYYDKVDCWKYLIYFLFFEYPVAICMQNMSVLAFYRLCAKYLKLLLLSVGFKKYILRTSWCACTRNPCLYA